MKTLKLFILLFLIAVTSIAAVPQTINYQGHLANSGGAPVNAAVDMTFTIYNAATNGTNLWTEDQTVQVNNGIYAVALGAINPIDPAIIDGDLWLGVKVATDAEMTPRQKLNSVPFAMRSAFVDDDVLTAIKVKAKGEYTYLVDNGDNTVYDPITGLMWRKGPLGPNNWYETTGAYDATYNPSSSNLCSSLSDGGFSDWRVPSVVELQSIWPGLGEVPHDSIDVVLDLSLSVSSRLNVWTSFEHETNTTQAVVMMLRDCTAAGCGDLGGLMNSRGIAMTNKSDSHNSLCVR